MVLVNIDIGIDESIDRSIDRDNLNGFVQENGLLLCRLFSFKRFIVLRSVYLQSFLSSKDARLCVYDFEKVLRFVYSSCSSLQICLFLHLRVKAAYTSSLRPHTLVA